MRIDLYAVLLWLAIGALTGSLLALLLAWTKVSARAPALSIPLAAVALLTAVGAGVLHWVSDHDRAGANPMPIGPFLGEHLSPVILAAGGILSMVLAHVWTRGSR